MKNRYILENVVSDLSRKMVFIGGPRQVGKTTLAKNIGRNSYKSFKYYNWDDRNDRKQLIDYRFPQGVEILLYDELHKYGDWKNYIKGVYDKHNEEYKFLVTGSARLDIYRRGGDSLSGRYFYYVLHPFSVAELLQGGKPKTVRPFGNLEFDDNPRAGKTLSRLRRYGGFPEPYMQRSVSYLKRWHSQRIDRLVDEEIRSLEVLKDVSNMQILVELLPERVGSLLSINNLREDLEINHETVARYIDILDRFYYSFRVPAFARSRTKSMRRQRKLYLWDWTEVDDEGAKIENLVASHLLKYVDFVKNTKGQSTKVVIDVPFVYDDGIRLNVEAANTI